MGFTWSKLVLEMGFTWSKLVLEMGFTWSKLVFEGSVIYISIGNGVHIVINGFVQKWKKIKFKGLDNTPKQSLNIILAILENLSIKINLKKKNVHPPLPPSNFVEKHALFQMVLLNNHPSNKSPPPLSKLWMVLTLYKTDMVTPDCFIFIFLQITNHHEWYFLGPFFF